MSETQDFCTIDLWEKTDDHFDPVIGVYTDDTSREKPVFTKVETVPKDPDDPTREPIVVTEQPLRRTDGHLMICSFGGPVDTCPVCGDPNEDVSETGGREVRDQNIEKTDG